MTILILLIINNISGAATCLRVINKQELVSNYINFHIYTYQNIREELLDNGSYFLILKTNRNCMDCFTSMNNYVRKVKNEFPETKFIVVSLIDSTVLDRKRSYHATKNLLPDFDGFYFQYNKPHEQTFFNFWNTYYSPEILIIKKGSITHIPYKDVFEYPSLQLSDKVIQTISEQLK